MYSRYLLTAYFDDSLIYKKRFKSFNNLIKVCCGFDSSIFIEVTDLVFDRVHSDYEIKDLVFEFKNNDDEMEVY